MKSLSIRLGVTLVIIGLALFTYAEVWGADWKLYGSNEMYLGYYDAQSIIRPSENVVRVWVKWDYTKKGAMILVGRHGEKFDNLNYSINLNEINCLEKKLRIPSAHFYDNKGGVIFSSSSPSEWDFIIPESISEILYKEVCK